MSPDTSINQVINHISNPLCSNAECPNLENSTLNKKLIQKQQQQQKQPQQRNTQNTGATPSNSVWKAELRVRYIPNNFKELYENDKTTCHFYFNQIKEDYVLSTISHVDQDVAVQLCCLGIRHEFRDSTADKKHHIDTIEKEKKYSSYIPKTVIDTIKQKNLKKLIQAGYKKILTLPESEYMLKFFELLRTVYTYDQEQFIVSIGSGWNIPVDLVIGPQVGISYLTHSQGKPNKVADFSNIIRITTHILQTIKDTGQQNLACDGSSGVGCSSNISKGNNNSSVTNSPSVNKKIMDINVKKDVCSCSEIKTQIKISVSGNYEDLSITCNGIKVRKCF